MMNCKMGFSFYIVSLMLILLLHVASCEPEYHNNHQNELDICDLNPNICGMEAGCHRTKDGYVCICYEDLRPTVNNSCDRTKRHHWNSHDVKSTTELSTTPVVQNGTFMENVKDTFNASLGLLVGVPIVGIIVLCCCCYCCCKCCAVCCEDSDDGKVIVVQQNNVQNANPPPAQHTQVILQQPVYQTPVYGMQPMAPQWGPATNQQWAAPSQPYQNPGPYDNPAYGEPSAPPPQYGQKY